MYRPEHPKPQFERKNWLNLNGQWDFEFDFSGSGEQRGMYKKDAVFTKKINVPFCPESELSGIGYTDFLTSVWYRRNFEISEEQIKGRIFLHFGAVDYIANVYINGVKVGTHRGGYVSFQFEVTDFVAAGVNTLVVHAVDDTKNENYPSGKQDWHYQPSGCLYTRTTGIWQTVWLEFTPRNYIQSVKYYPDAESCSVQIQANLVGQGVFFAVAEYEGVPMGSAAVQTQGGNVSITIPLKEKYLWELGKGRLYDLKLCFCEDEVSSYFGLRKITYENQKFYLNGKSVFQRLVLDQGYYPDGILTAPSDAALKHDVELGMGLGFNGARLHEKIFEERYLYHCDRAGYMVWGEYPSWGIDYTDGFSIYPILSEWLEEINRDFNHPCIVGWCPLNETNNHVYKLTRDEIVDSIYRATKAVDTTRPCIDASGFYHVQTDIYDVHDYSWNMDELKERYGSLREGKFNFKTEFQPYHKGQHMFVSEFGGASFNEGESWGLPYEKFYDKAQFLKRLDEVVSFYLDHPDIFAFCYTQLYDVEGEVNGFYTYHREAKFDKAEVHRIFSRIAAVEKDN